MQNLREIIKCSHCGVEIDGSSDTTQHRVPCAQCGSHARTYDGAIIETIVARDGIGSKVKRSGEKKPYIEDLTSPSYSRRLEKIVHREQIIDRDNDRYFELVTDYESGEIIHHCEEPLTAHQGHGSAKLKTRDASN